MNGLAQAETEALVGELVTEEDPQSEARFATLNDPTTTQVVDDGTKGKRGGSPVVLKKLSVKHKQIISMSLQGENRDTVAEACGCTPTYVSMILRQPLARQYISELTAYLDVRLAGMYEKSLDAVERGLGSRDGKVALAAAKLQMQATGKLAPSKESEQTAEDVVANILNIGGTVVLNSGRSV